MGDATAFNDPGQLELPLLRAEVLEEPAAFAKKDGDQVNLAVRAPAVREPPVEGVRDRWRPLRSGQPQADAVEDR